jgi:hypothetical protein
MDTIDLTLDQKRLLYLISKFSRPSESRDEEETWIKKIPLMALIYFGIEKNILTEYDFAPTLVEYMGAVRFANISKEGEDDIADLRVSGLLKRLKLATSHHVYVSAYRITPKGLAFITSFGKEITDAIDTIFKCDSCSGEMNIQTREDSPYMVCEGCPKEKIVEIFTIKELAYVSSPVFSDIWLPMD